VTTPRPSPSQAATRTSPPFDARPRAVILAAGDGGRLGAHTLTVPKPLVPLNGRAIVDYTLEGLVEAGVREAVVVTGYREAQVVAALADGAPPELSLAFVTNRRFHGGASLSLRAARSWCGDAPFLLVMSDHVLSGALVRRLAESAGDGSQSRVAADFGRRPPAYVEEATKLAVDDSARVTAIGKHLDTWQALDTGAFALAPSAWDALDAVPEDCELSVVFTELARREALFAADVSGAFWYDIDTADDLAAAAALLPLSNPRELAERRRS